MSRGMVILFGRSPRLGTVKSRLAAGIGRQAARRFYLRTTGTVLRRLSDPRWDMRLAITPDDDMAVESVWPVLPSVIGQGNGDLGERMERAMLRYRTQPVLIVGSDIPDLSRSHISAAFDALGQRDVVFGKASDGGYWLVGARLGSLGKGLFGDVRWSGPHALEDTLANARSLTIAMLGELDDIDTIEDLERWRGEAG